jgi:hypothetical protein
MAAETTKHTRCKATNVAAAGEKGLVTLIADFFGTP